MVRVEGELRVKLCIRKKSFFSMYEMTIISMPKKYTYTQKTYNIVCRVCIFASSADSLCSNILRSWLTLSCSVNIYVITE